jgi:sterol desaturase/sphingolipid hydroxylase (fatty acid hydroxylase superfamily)
MSYAPLISFVILATVSVLNRNLRAKIFSRDLSDWLVDVASLVTQFFILPIMSLLVVEKFCAWAIPSLRGAIGGGWLTGIAMYVIMDYLWYWNHRIFHADTPLWALHSTHHKPTQFDVFMTARNALVSHFAMVYFWGIGIASYVLENPTSFLVMAAIGGIVNFWSHTHYNLPQGSVLAKILGSIFVLPMDHAWHHSREEPGVNFGTFLNIWDRFHGTFHRPGTLPKAYGEEKHVSFWKQLVWPV